MTVTRPDAAAPTSDLATLLAEPEAGEVSADLSLSGTDALCLPAPLDVPEARLGDTCTPDLTLTLPTGEPTTVDGPSPFAAPTSPGPVASPVVPRPRDAAAPAAADPAALRPTVRRGGVGLSEASAAQLLRMVLDLRVDSMLLTLGAASADHESHVPWRRWMTEDLDLCRELATTLFDMSTGRATASHSAQGGSFSPLDPERAVGRLAARAQECVHRLDELLAGTAPGPLWRAVAHDVRESCRARLGELRWHQVDLQERAGGARAAAASAPRPHYLPGELLG